MYIDRHPRHPAASRVILSIHINPLVHQGKTCVLINIQDIQLHRGSSWASIRMCWYIQNIYLQTMIRQKCISSPIIPSNLALDKVLDCDSDLMTEDESECDSNRLTEEDSSFLTCSSGRGEDTSLPGQVDMDQLKLKVDDTKPASRTPSNN